MRLGFAITGIGAACAFAVVSSRSTLALHGTSHDFFASQARSAAVDLVTRDADDVIRLDQLLSLEPTLLTGEPPGRLLDKQPPLFDESWPLPLTSLGPERGLGLDISIGGGAAPGSGDLAQAPPPPPEPDSPVRPLEPTGLAAAGAPGPVSQLPPDTGGPPSSPPVVPPPPDLITPPDPTTPPSVPDSVDPPPPITPFALRPAPLSVTSAPPASGTPEPSSWIAMLVGFWAIGASFRRRRAQQVQWASAAARRAGARALGE